MFVTSLGDYYFIIIIIIIYVLGGTLVTDSGIFFTVIGLILYLLDQVSDIDTFIYYVTLSTSPWYYHHSYSNEMAQVRMLYNSLFIVITNHLIMLQQRDTLHWYSQCLATLH